MGDSPSVLTSRDGAVLTVVLNRPERLNAVSTALYEELVDELERAYGDHEVRAIVVTGAGRAFCAGADLKAHAEAPPRGEERARYLELGQEANRLLQEGPKPVVAAVHGAAVGAGLELALSADFLIVAADAKLRLPEVALGTFIGGGVSYTLAERVGVLKARELVYFGDFFTGQDAADMGLASAAVSTDRVVPLATEWATRLSDRAPLSMAAAKSLIGPAGTMSRKEALAREREALARVFDSEDWSEGIAARREGRPPRYRGA